MPYAKNHIRVNVQKRSGFDKSHRQTGSSFCGTLTPLFCDELIPNSRVSLRIPISVQLPPLASQTFMNVKYRVEAFFVPMRLLCASFEDFFCDFPKRVFTVNSSYPQQSEGAWTNVRAALPVIKLVAVNYSDSVFGAGTLSDYLGLKINGMDAESSLSFNPLPFIAYHKIWEDWYRNPRVQNPAFSPNLGGSDFSGNYSKYGASFFPSIYFHRSFVGDGNTTVPDNSVLLYSSGSVDLTNYNLADGVSMFSLRQRNFGNDYFTSARVSAQQGSPSSVSFDTSGATGEISIAALRAANSLQQFRERNNLPSPRLVDQVKARYNANLSDGVAQRPICIGTASFDVYSRGVDQTANSAATSGNIFNTVGSEYGRASASGSEFVINDFTANEPGYLMVLGSLVPEVTYSSGILPMFKRYLSDGSITDMACALLQNVGDQPIFDDELRDVVPSAEHQIFGYQDRYADFMFLPNQVHGELRDGKSLESFVLQRSFGNDISLNSSFLQIPKNYLDGVFAVSTAAAGLSYWYDAMLMYKVSQPLAEFSIPSLQDPAYEYGESIVLRRNGQIF